MEAENLEFISKIKRDGSGTEPVAEDEIARLKNEQQILKEDFQISCLSISEGTYIASGFNSYVVKIKESAE